MIFVTVIVTSPTDINPSPETEVLCLTVASAEFSSAPRRAIAARPAARVRAATSSVTAAGARDPRGPCPCPTAARTWRCRVRGADSPWRAGRPSPRPGCPPRRGDHTPTATPDHLLTLSENLKFLRGKSNVYHLPLCLKVTVDLIYRA